jgi:hypothetical protein
METVDVCNGTDGRGETGQNFQLGTVLEGDGVSSLLWRRCTGGELASNAAIPNIMVEVRE